MNFGIVSCNITLVYPIAGTVFVGHITKRCKFESHKNHFCVASQEQLSLDSRLETLCQSFISHNLQSGNFGSLVTVFLHKVAELLELSDQER